MSDDVRRKLRDEAADLASEVGRLSLTLEQSRRRQDRQRLGLQITVVGLVLDVILSLAAIWILHTQSAQNARLEKVTNDALCPMFSLFLGSYNPDSRAPGVGREAYEDAYSELRRIYGPVLGCATAIVPPRTDQSTLTPSPPPR